jgi:acrylyl-CoA reductase (NADPH)
MKQYERAFRKGQYMDMTDTTSFQAYVVDRDSKGFRALSLGDLPEGDVLVEVSYSSINYKDALAVTGKGKIIRSFPLVPGIDMAGTVVSSSSDRYQPGDEVLLTGWGVGERHSGGFSPYARVRSEWLIPLPKGLTLQQAMGLGTAGLTAMLCVMALEQQGLAANRGEVAVTGATGGVGSFAVLLLAKLGQRVTAVTRKAEASGYLSALGAEQVLPLEELLSLKRPLESERWGAAIDTVGGGTLPALLSSTAYGGSIAACGLAGGAELQTTVYPFILRGISLLGIDSVMAPFEQRQAAWDRISELLKGTSWESIYRVIPMGELPEECERLMNGSVTGRIVVDVHR